MHRGYFKKYRKSGFYSILVGRKKVKKRKESVANNDIKTQ